MRYNYVWYGNYGFDSIANTSNENYLNENDK